MCPSKSKTKSKHIHEKESIIVKKAGHLPQPPIKFFESISFSKIPVAFLTNLAD
jgi:hypothetical protein